MSIDAQLTLLDWSKALDRHSPLLFVLLKDKRIADPTPLTRLEFEAICDRLLPRPW
jgi:hypothetical protein